MLKRLFYMLLAFFLVVVLLIVGVVFYIKPERSLDLAYDPLPIKDKVMGMVTSMKPELRFTEKDINDLLKKKIVENTKLPDHMTITGADFMLERDNLIADINMRWYDKVDVGAKLSFDLTWKHGAIVVKHKSTHIKKFGISPDQFHLKTYEIPIEPNLPDFLKVQSTEFGDDEIVIRFGLG